MNMKRMRRLPLLIFLLLIVMNVSVVGMAGASEMVQELTVPNTPIKGMRFSDLIRHLDRRCTSGCSLPAASSCIVLRSEEMDELIVYLLGMLEEAATQHENRAAQDRQLEKLCRDPRFDE